MRRWSIKVKARLPAEISLAAMVDDLAHALGWSQPQLEGPISVRNNSTVYIVRPGNGQSVRAILKCCRNPVTGLSDNESANRQFHALSRAHGALDSVGLGQDVPRPLLLLPAAGAYAMSWVEGEPLTAWLYRRCELSALVDACERAGHWLARFHTAGPLRAGVADIASKLIRIDEMRRLPVRHPVFKLALNALASTSDIILSPQLHISWLHGDCKADNLLISRANVVGIDMDLRYENSIEHDLAQFMNHLDLVLMRYRLLHLRRNAGLLQNSFILGYRKSGISINMDFLGWLRMWSALTLWHSSLVEAPPPWYKRWLLERQFSNLTGRIQAQVGRA